MCFVPQSDLPPGYMDVPQPINNVGKRARKSIDMSLDAGDVGGRVGLCHAANVLRGCVSEGLWF